MQVQNISSKEVLPLNLLASQQKPQAWLPNWKHRTVVIIASGPSLTKPQVEKVHQYKMKLQHRDGHDALKVIAVNDNYQLVPFADMLYACDLKWWNWQYEDYSILLHNFQGMKVTQDIDAAKQYGLHYIEGDTKHAGLETSDPSTIRTNLNSGAQALNIAYHTHARRVILLGFDCKNDVNGMSHWFGEHRDDSHPCYSTINMFFNQIAHDAKAHGLSIVNCTADTALTCFEKVDLEGALKML